MKSQPGALGDKAVASEVVNKKASSYSKVTPVTTKIGLEAMIGKL